MGEMKRKLSFNHSSEEEIKKFRINLSINCIENFSNEFFYEIFDYLDAWDIYNAFSNLNYRFQQLLDNSSILYKIKLIDHSIENEVLINNWTQIMNLNRKQIFSIHLLMSLNINHLLSMLYIDSSFHRLQSLVLIKPKPNILILILEKLISLPHLGSLTIEQLNRLTDLTDIYQIILDLPMLTYYKISTLYSDLYISLPISTNEHSSRLEYLIIDYCCTFNELSTILSYTPELCHLIFMESRKIDATIESIFPYISTNLTYLRIHVQHVKFDEFEMFIRQTHPKLKVLIFITLSKEIAYLYAHRWEQLIIQDLPQLEKFSLQYYEPVDSANESNMYFGESNSFFSSFWLERQWIFETEIECEYIIYSVRPFKKRWYEQLNVDNSTMEFSKSIRLSLSYISLDQHYELLITDIKQVLSVTQIHHLEISKEKLCFDILMQITNSLPQVTTMKLHSLSLDQARDSETDELIVFPSTESINQITKVYLEKMFTIEEVYSLMKLCRYMSYLKINSFDNMNADMFLRNTLKKVQHDSNEYLRLLCFPAPASDDSMIQTLEKMKNDYTINRINNYMYLQWK